MVKARWLFLLIVTAVLVAGCGQKPRTEQVLPPDRKEAPPKTVLRIAMLETPAVLDPATAETVWERLVAINLFEGLVRRGADGNLEPVLAERWEMDAKGMQYTFFLKRGVKFHNGKEMTAADVKASWERVLESSAAGRSSSIFMPVTGARAKMTGQAPEVTGIQVEGDYVLRVILDYPDASFLSALAHPAAVVTTMPAAPPVAANTEKPVKRLKDTVPLGTGPFQLVEWYEGGITLGKNADYHGGNRGPERVELVTDLDPESALIDFQAGDLDVVLGIPAGLLEEIRQKPYLREHLNTAYYHGVWYLGFNLSGGLFQDTRLRQAIAYALDQERLEAFDGAGMPWTNFLPPGVIKEEVPWEYSNSPRISRLILIEAGFGDGKPLPETTLYYPAGEMAEGLAENVRQQLAEAGVVVTKRAVSDGELRRLLAEGSVNLFLTEWRATYNDPVEFFAQFEGAEAGRRNPSRYANPEVGQLLSQARAVSGLAAREELYGQAARVIAADAPEVPLWRAANLLLVSQRVGGFQLDELGMVRFENVTFTSSQ